MVDIKTEITIHSPVENVSAYASDPDRAPEWYVNIKAADWISPKPLRLGTLIAFRAQFLGRELAYTYEVVEFLPGKKLVMKTSEGPFPMETSYTWAATGPETTLMTLRNRGVPTGFSRLFAPFMASAMRRTNKKDLQRIKRILEK